MVKKKFLLKITKEVYLEYKKRLKNLKYINDDIRKKYLKIFYDHMKNKNRSGIFQVISFIEDWTQRAPKIKKNFKGGK